MAQIIARPRHEERSDREGDAAPMVVHFRPETRLDEDGFIRFCQDNSELRIEQTARGDLVIMAPAFSESGWRNAELSADFVVWSRKTGGGRVFDSSSGFKLPNGALRSPDISWIAQQRLDGLSARESHGFMPLCPDFVLELRSPTDRLPQLKAKMKEYMESGAKLGWLVDPVEGQIFVYRPGQSVDRLERPLVISGEPVLKGFALELDRFW